MSGSRSISSGRSTSYRKIPIKANNWWVFSYQPLDIIPLSYWMRQTGRPHPSLSRIRHDWASLFQPPASSGVKENVLCAQRNLASATVQSEVPMRWIVCHQATAKGLGSCHMLDVSSNRVATTAELAESNAPIAGSSGSGVYRPIQPANFDRVCFLRGLFVITRYPPVPEAKMRIEFSGSAFILEVKNNMDIARMGANGL
ncbi:hypothetical protein BO78DRAFT_437697 [Aspergillus sclerotiicarbonarius CBS 121057]|uniref:Uncharacterized protein n=1 Tax=Aspergillus sclerotiicarbonarius (strain CBS 121057 / IBT 28362) TaxID=1448318 RepID=A0A319DSQ2_ASPSB|nr:hypothetical protein BO78DRAFT_437697 [Aspergillus sclerotiicarbonarius CBS 121057]